MSPTGGGVVDLRSDTVTKPTAAMRRAMATAEVGDDVLGDDPTVQRLEAEVAAVLGKEAAVYTPSGTMANQIALRALTEPGDEVLVEAESHVYYYEAGGPAALSGVLCRCLPGERGVFDPEAVLAALRPPDLHFAPTRLLCLENTHNRGGGKVWPLDRLADVAAAARERGIAVHLDGARLWNASAATGVPEAAYAGHADTVMVSFSKGLGAPVGSALAGDAAVVARARRFRKQLGGGMRQAGVIAAGALHGLLHHRDRLGEDHANARRLADGLAGLPGVDLDPASVETNIVYFQVGPRPAADVVEVVGRQGVRLLATGPATVRAVTSLEVDRVGIDRAVAAVAAALA